MIAPLPAKPGSIFVPHCFVVSAKTAAVADTCGSALGTAAKLSAKGT